MNFAYVRAQVRDRFRRLRFDPLLIAAAALALPLIIPFLGPGLTVAADSELHLYRTLSAVANLQAGFAWPRWTPFLHQGFGYPLNNFYAPGIHILAALLFIHLHIDLVASLKVVQFGATLLYPLGAYVFARTFASRAGALAAAAAYLYAPMRFQELWAQMNLSQFCAMALLPWLLWAIAWSVKRPGARPIAVIGLLLGSIVVIHHPTAFLFTPFAGLYGLILTYSVNRSWRIRIKALAGVSSGMALGLLLSAVYWLPALLELSFTQINRYQSGMFSVAANFVNLNDLLAPIEPIDLSLNGLQPLLKAGQPQMLIALIGMLILCWLSWRTASKAHRHDDPVWLRIHLLMGTVTAAICLFLITPASSLVWSKIPLADLIVYPWRLLGVLALAVIPASAALPLIFPARWRAAVAGALIGVFFIAVLPMFYAPITFKVIPAQDAATAIIYEQQTGNVGMVSGEEYLPRWAIQRPLNPGPLVHSLAWLVPIKPELLPTGVTFDTAADCRSPSSCYDIHTSDPFTLIFQQMYFPGWQVRVNGQAVETSPNGVSGLLGVAIPAGGGRVEIWYGGTATQAAGDGLSVCGVLIAVGLLGWAQVRRVKDSTLKESAASERDSIRDNRTNDTHRLGRRVVAGIIGFMLINQAIILPHTPLFRRQSDPAAPPASHAAHILFGDNLELVGYDLNTQSAASGQTIHVRLYWHLRQPTTLSLSGSVHLTGSGGRGDWGGTQSLNLGSYSTTQWTPAHYSVNDYEFQIAPDAPPYVGQLQVSVFTMTPTLTYLNVAGSADKVHAAFLSTFRVMGSAAPDDPPLTVTHIIFSDALTLTGYKVQHSPQQGTTGGETCIALRWQAQRDDLPELAVMLHVLDKANTLIQASDSPPLDSLYPTNLWLKDQVLDDLHCFMLPSNATSLAIGLYSRIDGARLPAFVGGVSDKRLLDDALTIPLSDQVPIQPFASF